IKGRKARALIFWVINRPTRMLSGIHAVELSIVHCNIMHVARAGYEFDDLHHLPGLDVIFHQSGRVTFVAWDLRVLAADYLPDMAVLIFKSMQPLAQIGSRKHEIDHPCLGVDSHQRFEPVGVDPQFAIFPSKAMTGAAIIFGAEWNLPMADLLAVHIGLKNPLGGYRGMAF